MTQSIDWTPFDRFSESTCTCVCDAVYRSHAKFVMALGLVARKPCPACGSTALRGASSDPEAMTIGASERRDKS